MRFTTLTDYGVRAVLEIAASKEDWVSIEFISERQKMSDDYLRTALNALKRAGILESRRGREGGFRLARPADQIHLADLLRAIDGPLTSVRGQRPEGVEYQGAAVGLEKIWIALRSSERKILDSVSVSDLVSGNLPPFVQSLADDPTAWGAPNS
jgi:Rrf2 family protein